MKFSDIVWHAIEPIYQQIIEHPFNVELANGTLEKKRFLFYMEQDAYYLISFSRTLALIAARATSTQTIQQFLNFALGALVAERQLHASFLPANCNHDQIEPSPACLAYSQFLLATAATASLEEAVAAVLPCFWIYREVGRHISAHCNYDNPYIKWIETYSSPEFSLITDQAIQLLDELANRCTSEAQERMRRAFKYSALFEWHFWDSAYKVTTFAESYRITTLEVL